MMKRKVEDALFAMGVPAADKGFDYIVDAVLILDKFPKISAMDLYSQISEKHNATKGSVERGIRHAFFVCRRGRKQKEVNHYIGVECTSNKDSIYHLYRMVKREVEDEISNTEKNKSGEL